MDTALANFIGQQDDETTALSAAYQMYQLIKMTSPAMVLSAVRELNGMRCFKIKALISLLNLPSRQEPPAVWPKNQDLLNLNYEERNLTDYDPDTGNL